MPVRRLGNKVRDIYAHAVAEASGADVGDDVRFLGTPILDRAPGSTISIGDRSVLCSDSRRTALGVAHPVVLRTLSRGAELIIGSDTGLSGGSVCAARRIVIGSRVLVGADAFIADTDFHPIDPVGRRFAGIPQAKDSDQVMIEDDVFLGAGCRVLKGVTIGWGSVVAAGAIVTRDVAPRSVVAGIPARVVGSV